jgi:hypothetical protein
MLFNKKSHILLPLFVSIFSSVCFAGTQTGTVKQLHKRASDGLIYFFLSGTPTGSPSCASNPYWMIRDENSNTGKQQLALLLSAKATGGVVTIYGAGTCNRWGDGEDVNDIVLE